MFAPLFGCLFGEVVQKIEAEPDALVKLVESEAFGMAAKAHHEQYGIAAHPFVLVKGFRGIRVLARRLVLAKP